MAAESAAGVRSDLVAACETFVKSELEGELHAPSGSGGVLGICSSVSASFACHTFAGNDSSHDFFHILRVRNMALSLAKASGLVGELLETVELAALLHDLKDWKYSGDDDAGPAATYDWLVSQEAPAEQAALVRDIVASIGFKTEIGGSSPADTLTGDERTAFEVVQDADRLDAIGAIGVARCLTFGGAKLRVLHDPAVPPKLGMTTEEYKKSESTSMNHFYEKLLTLKDRMKTPAGKAVAELRHAFMEQFLDQFHAEWAGTR